MSTPMKDFLFLMGVIIFCWLFMRFGIEYFLSL